MPVSLEKQPHPSPEQSDVSPRVAEAKAILDSFEHSQNTEQEVAMLIQAASQHGEVEDRIIADEVGGLSVAEGSATSDEVPLLLGEQPLEELGVALHDIEHTYGEEALTRVVERIEAVEQEFVARSDYQETASWGGWGLEAVEPPVDWRRETLDGITFETNLPEGHMPFEPTAEGMDAVHPARRRLLPSALDALPAGEYVVKKDDTLWQDRKIHIIEDNDGKRIDVESTIRTFSNRETKALMQELGFVTSSGGTIREIPTPQTLVEHAARLGVRVHTFPDQGIIKSEDYLQAFRDGEYPVSTGSEQYYLHDSSDDHLTTMVLGGETLRTALQESASRALEGREDLDKYAETIDDFTAQLRAVIAPTLNRPRYDDSEARGRESLHELGKKIGLDPGRVDEIIRATQDKARTFAIPVKNLA